MVIAFQILPYTSLTNRFFHTYNVLFDLVFQYIRDNIVESIIASSTLLRCQLVVIANQIIKSDYPHKFPEVNDKILNYMQVSRRLKVLPC